MNIFQLAGNVIWQHVLAAFLSNWKTTFCGVAIAVFNEGPTLAAFFTGGWDHVDWGKFGSAIATVALGVVARDFNIGAIFSSAPRAQAVTPTGLGDQIPSPKKD